MNTLKAAESYAEKKLLESAGRSIFLESFAGLVKVKTSKADKIIDLILFRKPRQWRWAKKIQELPDGTETTITFKRPVPFKAA